MTLTLHRQIGAGAHGCIFEAEDHRGCLVAVKVINLTSTGNPVLLECLILSSFNCKYLNKTNHINYNLTTNKIYIITELATCDLKNYINNHVYSKSQALEWIRQLLIALATLHRARIIHGDIKSNNILIHNNNNIVLTDFTLSCFFPINYNQNVNKKVSTITYRAPEVLRSDDWNQKVDIWAVGCTMYEIMYGRQLFNVQNNDNDYLQAVNYFHHLATNCTTFIKPDNTIDKVDKIIANCLQFKAENRPSVDDILIDFFDFNLNSINIIKIKKIELTSIELALYQNSTVDDDKVVKDFVYRLLLIIKNYNTIDITIINITKVISLKMLNLNYSSIINKIDNYVKMELDLITKLNHQYYPF